jgi:Fur family transcriptional regulator, ferric uptake regulator
MTRAPEVPRVRFGDLADAVGEMRRRGLRMSASRRLVLQGLFAAEGPRSAEQLSQGLDLDLASVYRNLDMLERHGLVQHVHIGHGPGLYALVGRGEHEYLSCERCGAVRAVAPEELEPLRSFLLERFGYVGRFTHHAIVGICSACAPRSPAGARPKSGASSAGRHGNRPARDALPPRPERH